MIGSTFFPARSAIVDDFVDRVRSAGGDVSLTMRIALRSAIRASMATGLWERWYQVLPMLGTNLSAALVPLKGPTVTPHNFVSGDYSQTTGITGNGVDKWIDTHSNPFSLGIAASGHMLVWSRLVPGTSSHMAACSDQNGNNKYRVGTDTSGISVGQWGTTNSAMATVGTAGSYLINRLSTSSLFMWHNGVRGSEQTTSITPVDPINGIALFCRRGPTQTNNFWNGAMLGYCIGTSLSDAQAVALHQFFATINLARSL